MHKWWFRDKIISSEGYTFGQKWIISMIFRSFFITCIHKYGPNSVAASKMISIFMIFYYLYGIFWYCEVRSVGSLTLIKSRFGRGVLPYLAHFLSIQNWPVCCEGGLGMCGNRKVGWWFQWSYYLVSRQPQQHMWKYWWLQIILTLSLLENISPTHPPTIQKPT